jgi:O-antigen ligase
LALAKATAFVFVILAIFIPLPYRDGSFAALTDLFSSRATGLADSAIDSRWKLLDPMLALIKDDPLLGHGFGQKVEFISDDPRIRAQVPDGLFQTYSLEWGWLEIWLKLGLLGLLGFGCLFFGLLRALRSSLVGPAAWLSIGFVSGLVFLAVTHVFSPYLNHPLGLGYLLFLVPFLPNKTAPRGAVVLNFSDPLLPAPAQAKVAPLICE